ncbi:SpoIIE family protein phosphatase [Geothrix sp.]|uniref:SpoIIE family protein phosphatase n=1 Tax=Geothrix sp. TaxID=1962974 RepID=UPI0025BA38ED|nr:SpoIIE family protein phosphatase [Geothrix sp.]
MTPLETRTLERLIARRDHLADLTSSRKEGQWVDLMRRADAAIGAIEIGTWGTCAVCHDPMSASRMAQDPLLTVCLECLSEAERRGLERDLQSAGKVQRTLLPPPHLVQNGWEVAYHWEPRGVVSGDHVDLIAPAAPGDPLHLLLGDVSGKGVAASLLQAHLHALFRALVPTGQPLPDLFRRANELFADATSSVSYATLAALRLASEGRFSIANAGHPRPLLADGRGVRPIEGGGLPLGLFCDSVYAERELTLRPGQTLLLYTDGWTEGSRDDREFGIGRAAAALRRSAGLPLPDLLAACRADLEHYLAGSPCGDDLTLVAVRRAAA